MEYIKSKDICYLIMDTLSFIDERVIEHGKKTAYVVYHLLKQKGGYEEYEIAEYCFLSVLHDIGAYKTDNITDLLKFDLKDVMPHSIYGFLFLKYLSPFKDRAKILLYHHVDYAQLKDVSYDYLEIAHFLHLADMMDVLKSNMGDLFTMKVFDRCRDTRFSKEAIDLLMECQEREDLLAKLSDGSYEETIDKLFNYIMFTNTEKKEFLETLMYCTGLRHEENVINTVTSICISMGLSKRMKLERVQKELLYYASLLHDIGMLAVPVPILKARRPLTKQERDVVRKHIEIESSEMHDRLHVKIIEIIITHHEKADGSGYPNGLTDNEMNSMQHILQLADLVTALINKRAYHPIRTREEVLEILEEEVKHHHYNKKVAYLLIDNYDEIMDEVTIRTQEILKMHTKLQGKYQKIKNNFLL